jgi:glycosyltransferase involved in cell wall biosynthesis
MRVTVCACTYRRPEGLRALLSGLAAQRLASEALDVDFVIVDNEGSDEARSICDGFSRTSGRSVRYVVEPQRGISFARNACLDHLPPASEFFAMIDDDEVPEPDWLAELFRMQRATGADVVQGAVVPHLPEGAPDWIRGGRFFGWPGDPFAAADAVPRDGAEIPSAATNNVLVRCDCVRRSGLRFDTRLSLRGGEDALFFRALRRAGARLVYAERARVQEIVPPERATLRYLARVQYRQGHKPLPMKLLAQKAGAPLAERLRLRARTAFRGGAAILLAAARSVRALAAGGRRAALTLELLRACRGTGLIASAAGGSYDHYR